MFMLYTRETALAPMVLPSEAGKLWAAGDEEGVERLVGFVRPATAGLFQRMTKKARKNSHWSVGWK